MLVDLLPVARMQIIGIAVGGGCALLLLIGLAFGTAAASGKPKSIEAERPLTQHPQNGVPFSQDDLPSSPNHINNQTFNEPPRAEWHPTEPGITVVKPEGMVEDLPMKTRYSRCTCVFYIVNLEMDHRADQLTALHSIVHSARLHNVRQRNTCMCVLRTLIMICIHRHIEVL